MMISNDSKDRQMTTKNSWKSCKGKVNCFKSSKYFTVKEALRKKQTLFKLQLAEPNQLALSKPILGSKQLKTII
jgi:hypothetical protein